MRILILSSSTGGGHDMRARSLVSWYGSKHNSTPITTERYQALEESSGLYSFGAVSYTHLTLPTIA